MRPVLFDVNAAQRPALMTLCFVGQPLTFITVRIRKDVAGYDQAVVAAVRELAEFTDYELDLLAEAAKPQQAAAVSPGVVSVAVGTE